MEILVTEYLNTLKNHSNEALSLKLALSPFGDFPFGETQSQLLMGFLLDFLVEEINPSKVMLNLWDVVDLIELLDENTVSSFYQSFQYLS